MWKCPAKTLEATQCKAVRSILFKDKVIENCLPVRCHLAPCECIRRPINAAPKRNFDTNGRVRANFIPRNWDFRPEHPVRYLCVFDRGHNFQRVS